MEKIAIIGTGSWGCALANVLCDNGHQVIMYGVEQSQIDDINLYHKNTQFFEDAVLHENIKATNDLEACLDNTKYVLLTLPTSFVKSTLEKMKPFIKNKVMIINASKGFDLDTNMRISDTIRGVLDSDHIEPVVSLIGPSHAEEVVKSMLTTVCAVSLDDNCSKIVQEMFSNQYFRVYQLNDEIGAEYGVAFKNVIAVAAGIVAGLGYGDNTRAALVTRGLSEMVKYGTKKGGKLETYLGLTGVGDLIVTCSSVHSRNFQAGLEIGKANSAKVFMSNNQKTCEGIRTCKVIHEDVKQYGDIELPIIEAIYDVLYKDVSPETVVERLMQRDLKVEK